MFWSESAQAIYERGLAAFLGTRVRPDRGHTGITDETQDYTSPWRTPRRARRSAAAPVMQFGCVVGAIAFEAAKLQKLTDPRSETYDDANARKAVARIFGVDDEEVRRIESGFDDYFSWYAPDGRTKTEERDAFEAEGLLETHEMYQVGWHVAKRAVRHYKDLDAAETEAWALYRKEDLRHYKPRPLITQTEIDSIIDRFIEECEGDDCPDREGVLIG